MSATYNNSWLGYDLPFEEIEAHPSVQKLRQAGITKRIKSPEFHVTVGYFPAIELEALTAFVRESEAEFGRTIAQTPFHFNGYGVSDQPTGKYVYFCPDTNGSPEAHFLKQTLNKSSFYTQEKNCDDLHLSIGGADPFHKNKPASATLQQPLSVAGKLVFVGNDGTQFRKFLWMSDKKEFIEIETSTPAPKRANSGRGEPTRSPATVRPTEPARPTEPEPEPIVRTPRPVSTIAIFPKIQADTAAAVYLLKAYGEELFPGISQAKVVFWTALPSDKTVEQLEKDGYLMIDLGGIFDHHLANKTTGRREQCASTLVAQYLGTDEDPSIAKLLAWAKRDDLQGKGTMSADPLDRAFGLSGIIMNLNREYQDNLSRALDLIIEILAVHVREEYRRQVELPAEWEQLTSEGKGTIFAVEQGPATLQAAIMVSDNPALAGFLRAAQNVDLVIQRRTTGHTNLITQQLRSIDLRPVIADLRLAEASKKGLTLTCDLTGSGRVSEVPEWYYDDAANTIQNGGIQPQGVTPTSLSQEEIVAIIKQALPKGRIGALKRQKEAGR